MHRSSDVKWERDHYRELVPEGTISGTMSCSIPAELKAWISEEAHRRHIPVSWLVTEVLKLGRETYNLIGPPRMSPEHAAGYQAYEQQRADAERKYIEEHKTKQELKEQARTEREQAREQRREQERMLGDGPSTRGKVNYD